jgi:uroporphyrinogen decarboxylase
MNRRFEQALNCEQPDRIPFIPAIYEHKAWFVGETPSKVCRDPKLFLAALLAEYERVQPDALTVGIDVYNVEPEAVGCKVIYFEGDNTSVPAMDAESVAFRGAEGVASLKMPDPQKDGRMPLNLDVARNVMKLLGREVPIRGALSGPFSLVAHLTGLENLFKLMFIQPDLVRELLGFACEVIKRYGQAFIDLGCGLVMFDSQASSELISPLLYREFVLPRTRLLIDHFRERGVRNVPLIIGGDTTKMLDEYLETGANNVLCDVRADAKEFLRKCSPVHRAFRRNMDSTDFPSVSPDEVHRRAVSCLEESTGYPGFILGTAIVPYGTPLAHVEAIRSALREYKRPYNLSKNHERTAGSCSASGAWTVTKSVGADTTTSGLRPVSANNSQ